MERGGKWLKEKRWRIEGSGEDVVPSRPNDMGAALNLFVFINQMVWLVLIDL